ncbi:MAG TPA: adenylate/guanylate cyclase domain-containing protein [Candidatus Limnocylindrales bacterium]|nr:adenylate/guanylate cyclase domain-containing protein [Candidatus Limnocylindrales bacterium]
MGDATAAPKLRRLRRIFKPLPSGDRCKLCYAPYEAPFGPVVKLLGYGRWEKNPSLCGVCLRSMEHDKGGAEIELSFLFADLRGSTELSRTMPPVAYGRLLNAFYAIAARAVQAPGGNVDKYLGDGVFALFVPGFTGPDHAAKAIEAGRRILRETASAASIPADARPLPIGVAVHTGRAFVGVIGSAGDLTDFTALGEAVNVASRISSAAGARELLISDAAITAAGLATGALERRELTLKGVEGTVSVWSDRADVLS